MVSVAAMATSRSANAIDTTERMVPADELWALVLAARHELEQAIAAQDAMPSDAGLAESGELRDRVASATLELMRLERLWRRHSRDSQLGDLRSAQDGRVSVSGQLSRHAVLALRLPVRGGATSSFTSETRATSAS
jgi:hypothetical protein